MSKNAPAGLASLPLDEILTKRRGLRRRLAMRPELHPIRIAVLGGSTTREVVDLLELWLLDSGFQPVFHQSEYGRFYVEAVHDTTEVRDFRPDLIYLHTSVEDIRNVPALGASDDDVASCVERELRWLREIWDSLEEKLGCLVIQNNFEFPRQAILGNLDASAGKTFFVSALNRELARAAAQRPRLLIQDVCSIAARIGLDRWFDLERWFSFKIVTSPEGSNALAVSLAGMIRAIYGRSRKVLVLDLDNTLWGGVIGDDGVDKIQIGRETPVGEAYTAFQEYCLALRARGILLAVCSKNDESIAKQAFAHPESVLKLEHFAAFRANWEPKHENILALAGELQLGPDSFVFVDDNPAERALVEAQIEGIAVPDIGSDVTRYAAILERGRYFEPVSLSTEDLGRALLYRTNRERASFEMKFSDYGEYLDSLEMTAEIERFKPVYIERITQLANKTNQFNLTTRRYTVGEIQAVLDDPNALGLYGKLSDRFGDNGLISVLLGRVRGTVLDIELWLMSCRVLKRDMEAAMLDALAERALQTGVRTLRGCYVPTRKNAMVAGHYPRLGFDLTGQDPGGSAFYTLDLAGYQRRNRHIRVLDLVTAGE